MRQLRVGVPADGHAVWSAICQTKLHRISSILLGGRSHDEASEEGSTLRRQLKPEDAIPSIVGKLWDVFDRGTRKMKVLCLIIHRLLSKHFPGKFKSP